MTATHEIKQFDFNVDGVRYTVHITQGEGEQLWGTWNCHDCGVGGSAATSHKTLDEAVASGKADMMRHHEASHPTFS